MKSTLKFPINYSIKKADIANLLYSSNLGSNYWCSNVLGYESEVEGLLSGKKEAKMYDHEGERNYTLTLAHIKRGIQKLANSKEYAHHFSDILKENTDQTTGDVFLQFCLFGKVKYG
jgi:hypothetical protein